MREKSNTVREAVAAQVLEEIDDLVIRLENASRIIKENSESGKESAKALLAAGDEFKMAVTQFSQTATVQVSDAVERQAREVVTKTRAEMIEAMQDAARQAWRVSALDEADRLAQRLRKLASQFQPLPVWQRLAEAASGGLVGATAVLVVLLALGKL